MRCCAGLKFMNCTGTVGLFMSIARRYVCLERISR